VIGINSSVQLPAALGGLQGLVTAVNTGRCDVAVTSPLQCRVRLDASLLTELAPPPQPEPALWDCVVVYNAGAPNGLVLRRLASGWAQPGDPTPVYKTWAQVLAFGDVRRIRVQSATEEGS
jgi:hypothetical protein